MMFNIIRIVVWLILSICIIIMVKKSEIARKKFISIISVVICTIIVSVSGMFPVENIFVNYKSPENVFNYTNFGEIDEIIYGQDSCLIIYSKNGNTGGHYIIPKTAKGYKIPNYFTVKKVSHKFDKDGLFDVYDVKGTQDYYVFATVKLKENDNKIDVFNKLGEKVKSNIVIVENTDFIYFNLNDFPNDYYLLVNGAKVPISN